MSKTAYIIFSAFMVASMAGVLYFFYLVIFPMKVIEVVEPLPVLQDEYRPGDTVEYVVDYCRYVDAPSISTKVLINDFVYSYPEKRVNLSRGCGVITSSSTRIPEYAHSGTYHIEVTVTYELNPLHTYTKTFKTEEFQVVAD